jgi:peptidyl-prolyl cis-trans isomerase A (cyclophilin A)
MFRWLDSILAFCTLLCGSATAGPPIARFQSALGDFDVLLDREAAPVSVANFAAYANRGDYAGTFIHRSTTYNPASIQIVQGGGFMLEGNTIYNIPAQAPIVLETNRSNARGTIAMARTSQPISATSQWFFNLTDNNALNPGMPTGGYAVFGGVLGQGMNIVDRIGSAEVVDATGQLGPVFAELPLEGNSLIVFSDIRVEHARRRRAKNPLDSVRVERSSSLTGPWQTVASNLTTGAFNDTNAPAREAYYRIVTEP